MKKFLLFSLFMLLNVSFAFGQMNMEAQKKAVEVQRAEMKKLDLWAGKWEGSGWMQQGAEKQTFIGTENVQKKLDGLAMIVEGKFANKENVVIHETLAVVSYNPQTTNFDFSTYLATGNKGVYELKAIADGWQWEIPFPGGKIRYTTKLNAETWFEIGEMTRDDGKTWQKFFEMNLKRIK